jgi:hypothetical protein
MSVKGTTLFRQAWRISRPQVAPSRGSATPRQRITASSRRPAMSVRAVMSVIGGMLCTPTRMKA